MTKILVLVLAFFTYQDVDKCLESLMKQKKEFKELGIQNKNKNKERDPDEDRDDKMDEKEEEVEIDIKVLENPSRYSEKMKEVCAKYSSQGVEHYLSNQNIEMACFQVFSFKNKEDFLSEYDYICVSEGDVVLKDGSMRECYHLVTDQQPVCSINVSKENLKIPPHPPDAIHWIPPHRELGDHIEGPFGLQFVMFTSKYYYNFLDALEKKTLSAVIPLGGKVQHFSDTNLMAFMAKTGVKQYKTINNSLVHIGCDNFLDPKDEYWCFRNGLIHQKKIRVAHDLSKVEFEKL